VAEKFGANGAKVLELAGEEPGFCAPVVEGYPSIRAEIIYSIRHEMASSIDDVLARRIGLQFFDWRLAEMAAPLVAKQAAFLVGELLGRELGWSADQVRDAVSRHKAKIEELIRVAGLPA
jgi:glycerol-3-phosphate dehydrogenase